EEEALRRGLCFHKPGLDRQMRRPGLIAVRQRWPEQVEDLYRTSDCLRRGRDWRRRRSRSGDERPREFAPGTDRRGGGREREDDSIGCNREESDQKFWHSRWRRGRHACG